MDSLIFQHKLVRACVSNLEDIILFEKSVLNDISEFTSKNNLIKLLKSSNSCILLIKNANDNIWDGIICIICVHGATCTIVFTIEHLTDKSQYT